MPKYLCDGFDKTFGNVLLMWFFFHGTLSHLVTATNVGENLDFIFKKASWLSDSEEQRYT